MVTCHGVLCCSGEGRGLVSVACSKDPAYSVPFTSSEDPQDQCGEV